MEKALELGRAPPERSSFVHALQRFYGFHLPWEAGLANLPGLQPVMVGRSRLPHLRSDLEALGSGPREIDHLPRCAAVADLLISHAAALGSIYVMEGSTLGGQVLSRAVEAAGWAPPDGLSYFNPYGARTGAMWRGLRMVLDATPLGQQDAVIDGALRTFSILETWMNADHKAERLVG